MLVMPFLTASTPVRSGVVFSRRFRAAAGPVVSAGRPALGWLKRLCLDRGGAVDQPYLMPRWGMCGRRREGERLIAAKRGSATRMGILGGMLASVLCELADAL